MKKIICFLILCLMLSVLPLGIENELDKHGFISTGTKTSSVQFSETTIDMSTACKPPKEMCKLLTFLKTLKVKPTEFTTTVSGKLTEVKGTKYRKIITFESNGDGEDPCIYI